MTTIPRYDSRTGPDWQVSLRILRPWTVAITMLVAAARTAAGQSGSPPDSASKQAPADEPTSLFAHDGDHAWWISGQLNVITQGHRAFTSPYAGTNSLQAA